MAPLTFLVGPNSSGKSSIADALLFMAQSGFMSFEAVRPVWTGALVDLGSFKDTVFGHDEEQVIEIGFSLSIEESHRLRHSGKRSPETVDFEVTAQVRANKNTPEGGLKRLSVRSSSSDEAASLVSRPGKTGLFYAQGGGRRIPYDPRQPWRTPGDVLSSVLFSEKKHEQDSNLPFLLRSSVLSDIAETTQRVSSTRHPPQRTYLRDNGVVGGARRLLDSIDAPALEAANAKGRDYIPKKLVEGLSSLGIADDLKIARVSDYHTAVRLTDNVTRISSNLADFGYGTSQVIPVLEGCAMHLPGPLFIEQPEIHLHPRAQGQLAQIICETSRYRQVIIETHSEHMINRARRLVAEKKLSASDVMIHYVDRDEGGSHALTIELDELGNFSRDWPEGFYDERYWETMKIAEAQAQAQAQAQKNRKKPRRTIR